MKTARRILAAGAAIAGALFAIALFVSPAAAEHVARAIASTIGVGAGAGVLHAMIVIPWQPPLSRDDLEAIAYPEQANQPEVIPWALYDTQNLTTASAAPLTFFVNQNNDKTLSNMEGPGQLPDPQFFQLFYVAADILQIPVATALAGEPNAAIANVENVLKTNRATFSLTLANKNYGPFPLTFAHSTGGATFSGYAYGTAANGTSAGVTNNGIPGTGGFPFSGALVIPPKNSFNVTVQFAGALTLVGGPIPLRMCLVGNLYRRVN